MTGELTDEGAKYLSDALKSDNCKLTKLDVSRNELTAKGVEYLSETIVYLEVLRFLMKTI